MSLFGRTQTPSSSSSLNFQTPTRIHGPISKIPSFRISRIPQTRPLGRENINRKLKREGHSSELEVANKFQKLSSEEDEEERTVKEEESDSESDSEAERRLLANRSMSFKIMYSFLSFKIIISLLKCHNTRYTIQVIQYDTSLHNTSEILR